MTSFKIRRVQMGIFKFIFGAMMNMRGNQAREKLCEESQCSLESETSKQCMRMYETHTRVLQSAFSRN